MDTDDHGLFSSEAIRGNPRESAASAPCRLRGEGWSEGLGRPPPQGSGVDGGSVDPGRWSSIKIGGLSAWDSVNAPTTVVSGGTGHHDVLSASPASLEVRFLPVGARGSNAGPAFRPCGFPKKWAAPVHHAFFCPTSNQNGLARTLARRTKGASRKGRSAGERALRYGRKIGARIVLTPR